MRTLIAAVTAALVLTGCATGKPLATSGAVEMMAACQPHEQFKAMAAEQYGEVPVGMGMSQTGTVVELFVGPNSWTFAVVLPSGIACARAAGVGWSDIGSPDETGHRI